MFAALVGPANQDLIEMYCKSAEDMHRILSTSGPSHIWETSNETAWVMTYVYENFLHDAAQLGEKCTLAFLWNSSD